MDLIQILFKVLCLLLKLEIISGNAILQLLVGVLDFVELHFQFEDFLYSVKEIFVELLFLSFVFDPELLALLLYHTFLHHYHIWLFLLHLLFNFLSENINLGIFLETIGLAFLDGL